MKAQIIPDRLDGLYMWQMPDGSFIGNRSGEYLVLEGPPNSLRRQAQLQRYVKEELGIEEGRAVWRPAKPVTHSEHDDMMERMLEGKEPSFYEAVRQNPEEV